MNTYEQAVERVHRMTVDQVFRAISEPGDTPEQRRANIEYARTHVHTSDSARGKRR